MTKNQWYRFENHRWIEMDDGFIIKRLCLKEMLPLYADYKRDLENEKSDVDSNDSD